jgi:HlyD family secretion protein
LYATVEGIGSAREVARLCDEHIAFEWLCGGVGIRRPTFPVYAMRGCNASRLTSSSKCTTGFRASVHGNTRPEALPSIPVYACLRCPVTEDDIKFFEGNPADVVAELSAIELTAALGQARAALAAATAERDHVYAGIRDEELATLAAESAKAKSRLEYEETQLARTSYLTRSDVASRQALDQAENDVAAARADVAEAEANHAAAEAGPTREQRAIADAQVKAAAAALAVLDRRLEKTLLRSPADGIVTVVVAEVGENIRVGQPVLVIAGSGKEWLSFNAREDLLHGITVGTTVDIARPGANQTMPAVVTELVPLGPFATWQAERAIGDHDRNTLRLRLDPRDDHAGFEPGATVWLNR